MERQWNINKLNGTPTEQIKWNLKNPFSGRTDCGEDEWRGGILTITPGKSSRVEREEELARGLNS
jgi:hypothetical protein